MVNLRFVPTFLALALVAPLGHVDAAELLSFSLPTCGPCHAMAPTVARLAAEGIAVRHIDGSRDPALAARLQVSSYPTFVVVADGREVGRLSGITNYEQLRRLIDAAPPTRVQQLTSPVEPTTGRDGAMATVGGDWGAGQPVPPRPIAAGLAGQHAQLVASSVRLTMAEPDGRSFGTGTIVDSRQGEALVVTCAHLFRDANGNAIDPANRLSVELFDTASGSPRVVQRVAGQLISYDFEADVALVAIRPTGQVAAAPIAASPGELRVGDLVRSVGCDLGADPTVRESRVVDLNRYDGPPNIEAAGAPIQGRSGGGLFNAEGALIGVCNFADEAADEGIYAGLASIHAQLDKIGLSELYRASAVAPSSTFAAANTTPPVPAATTGLTPVERSPVVRGQNFVGATNPSLGEPTSPALQPPALSIEEEATLSEIVSRGERSEVVVLIRPTESGGPTEVVTLDSASPEFVAALRRLTSDR